MHLSDSPRKANSFDIEKDCLEHMLLHSELPVHKCDQCDEEFKSQLEFEWHTETNHEVMPFSCNKCGFQSSKEAELSAHIQTNHLDLKVNIGKKEQVTIACDQCDFKCRLNKQLTNHNKDKHQEPKKYKCKECDNKYEHNNQLNNHMQAKHMEKNGSRVYSCDACDFNSPFLTGLWKHKFSNHSQENMNDNSIRKSPTDFILNTLAEQNADIMEVVFELKESLKGAFEHFANGLQDNFDDFAEENRKKNDSLKAVITSIHNKVERIQQVQNRRGDQISSGPSVSQPTIPPKLPTVPPPPPQTSSTAPTAQKTSNKRPKTNFLQKPRVLYVGDSIAHNVPKKHLEDKTGTRMVAKKAYSSTYDKEAKWPAKNVNDVTREALSKAHSDNKYENVILSAPTVDITNLDTSKTKPSDNIEIFKQDVLISCKNMFTAAQKALNAHKQIKKAILIEHPDRFDTEDKDPLSIKAELVRYANRLYQQLWFESNLKHRIILGQHRLQCLEKTRLERFTDRRSHRYDGVHMYGESGRRAYTNSVLSILIPALLTRQQVQTTIMMLALRPDT